jgi:hypothetical protein
MLLRILAFAVRDATFHFDLNNSQMLQKVPTFNSFACSIIDLPQFCYSLPILPLTWPICGIRQYAQLQVRAKLCDKAMEPFGPIIIWVFTSFTTPTFDSSKSIIKPVFQMDSR